MRIQHLLGLVGLAVMVAAYSEPGAWERIYYWKLRQIEQFMKKTDPSVQFKIAPFLKDTVSFEDFIKHINFGSAVSKNTDADTLGPSRQGSRTAKQPKGAVEKKPSLGDIGDDAPLDTMASTLQENGYTGPVDMRKIIEDGAGKGGEAEATFSNFLGRLRQTAISRLEMAYNKINEIQTKLQDTKLQPTERKALEADLNIVKDLNREPAKALLTAYNLRTTASVASFKPYQSYQKVTDASGNFDAQATFNHPANEGAGISQDELLRLWNEHANGKPATPELVATFKPRQDFSPPTKRNGQEIDIAQWKKDSPSTSEEWMDARYEAHFDAEHQNNISQMKASLKAFKDYVCPR